MKNFLVLSTLLFLASCSNYENDNVNTDNVQDSVLLYPPCLKK